MKGFHLSAKELEILRSAHREAKRTNATAAYKINAVILLGSGWTLKKVKNALLLDDETLRSYVDNYREGGISALLNTNHKGRTSSLNARYHYSKEVKEWLRGKKIKLVFLPAYSPNLNLIERLWKFFKKKVLYNRYYKNIKEFRRSCIDFFSNIEQYSNDIAKFMNADFDMV